LVANLIDQLAAGAAPSGAGQNKEELKGASLPA
jgi:hypothetical protein